MRSTALTTLGLAALAGALVSAAAGADPPVAITEARAAFPERAYVLSLPSKMRLRAGAVRVFENGRRVSGVSVVPAGGASPREFGVVLVIDASQSMRGRPILGAMAAARAFAREKTAQEQLAVITFNSRAHLLLGFTSDGGRIQQTLTSRPRLGRGTNIYDAVRTALKLITSERISAGSIVVLSDGADTGSRTTEAAAARLARETRVRVFTVGLRSRSFDRRALEGLATDANGEYSLASSTRELRQIYSALGVKFAREYLVTYRSKAAPGQNVGVAVRVRNLPGVATSGYVTPRVASQKRHAARGGYHESFWHKVWTSPLTMVFVAFIAASLVALTVMLMVGSRRRGTLRKRMAEFVSLPVMENDERPSVALADRVEEETERLLRQTRWWGRFLDELELAGITWSPRRIVLFTFIGTFIAIWSLSLVTGSALVALIGFAIPFVVRALIKRKVDKKRRLFADQLPDNLQVLASALRAGHSFIGALSVVVEDAPEPSRSEFRRVIADEQLGVPLEDALQVVVDRMDSRELEQVALVAAVQRNSGGNTAEVLDRVTDTIRERFELRRMIRTLTAQGRMSRWVVSLLPLFLLLVITLLNPSYMHVLYATTGGRIALVFATAMVIAGSMVIKRIVNIRV